MSCELLIKIGVSGILLFGAILTVVVAILSIRKKEVWMHFEEFEKSGTYSEIPLEKLISDIFLLVYLFFGLPNSKLQEDFYSIEEIKNLVMNIKIKTKILWYAILGLLLSCGFFAFFDLTC